MRAFRFVSLATITLCGACQTYQSAALTELAPGTAVRVSLTDVGRQRLASTVGPNVEFVTGTFLGRDSAGLQLRIAGLRRHSGPDEVYPNLTPVVVPADAVATVERRKLSAARSALLGGLIAGGAVAIGGSMGGESVSHARGVGGQSSGQ